MKECIRNYFCFFMKKKKYHHSYEFVPVAWNLRLIYHTY